MNCAEFRYALNSVRYSITVDANTPIGIRIAGTIVMESNTLLPAVEMTHRQKQCNRVPSFDPLEYRRPVYRQGYSCDRWTVNGFLGTIWTSGKLTVTFEGSEFRPLYPRPKTDRVTVYPWDNTDPFAARQKRMMDYDGSVEGPKKYMFGLDFYAYAPDLPQDPYAGRGTVYPAPNNETGEFYYGYDALPCGYIRMEEISAL